MQFSAQVYAPKAHRHLVEAVSILNEAFDGMRNVRTAMEPARAEMKRASEEIVGQSCSKAWRTGSVQGDGLHISQYWSEIPSARR